VGGVHPHPDPGALGIGPAADRELAGVQGITASGSRQRKFFNGQFLPTARIGNDAMRAGAQGGNP
jgi:hypothetical protein